MFVNLPVKNLARTTEFFAKLGFSFDQPSPDGNTTRMIIGDDAFVMLHSEAYFKQFTQGDVTDLSQGREVVIGVSRESRAAVDALVEQAVTAGGQSMGDAVDQGFMYMRAFRDLDGHQWSFIYLQVS
jgi:predicted lactoylglutathione lyase